MSTLRAVLAFIWRGVDSVCSVLGVVALFGLVLTIATGKLAGCCLGEVCLASMVPHTLRAAQEAE